MQKKAVRFLPMFFMMCLIFWYSSKTAEESSVSSGKVTEFVMGLYEREETAEDMSAGKSFKALEHIIRKLAHMAEYAVLAVCALFFYHTEKGVIRRKEAAYALLTAVLYAATDEFHQLFVPGRAGRLTDVLIDSAGALCGTAAVCLLSAKRMKIF